MAEEVGFFLGRRRTRNDQSRAMLERLLLDGGGRSWFREKVGGFL